MSDQYVGEIRMFGGPYAPEGWMFCWGGLLPVTEYTNLFAVLGTRYGGDGHTTFGLPDLRGRVAVGQGNGAGLTPRQLGQTFGTETVALQPNDSSHGHTLMVSQDATGSADPLTRVLGAVPGGGNNLYRTDAAATTALDASSVGALGQGHAHNNMMPGLGINYIIALDGIFPTRD
ncbi:MAG: phage tail protein [Candidatus Firestonebacteria bacterium]|nr:phage tail protein [Candidatus Firestonebacteria bacterium]